MEEREAIGVSRIARKAHTSTILGSLRRVGRIHGDSAKGCEMKDHGRPERIVQSAGVDNSRPDHARGTQSGGKGREGRVSFWVRESSASSFGTLAERN